MKDRTTMTTPNRAGSWAVTLFASKADLDAGKQTAGVTGLERRDAALILAARCLCGLDVSLPPARVVLIEGPHAARYVLAAA